MSTCCRNESQDAAFSNPSRSSSPPSSDWRLSKVDLTADAAAASALVTVDERERAGLGRLFDLIDLLLKLRPELVELAACLVAGLGLGRPEVCEAVDELVGGALHVLGGRLHGGLVERERVGGERP